MAEPSIGSRITRRATLKTMAAACLGAPVLAAEVVVPEIALHASDGRPVLADGSRWRATYIDFWASWCAPCKLSFPWMDQMLDELSGKGLRIVAISLDRREADALKFLQPTPPRFAIALDHAAETAKIFNVQVMPSSYLIAADRRLIYAHRGFRLDDRADLERRLRAAIA